MGSMKRTLRVLFLSLFTSVCGCIEPYPGWTVKKIQSDAVPKKVLKAFESKCPKSTVVGIQRSTFGSRIEGYPKLYKFTYISIANEEHTVILDERGEVSTLEFWFDIDKTP